MLEIIPAVLTRDPKELEERIEAVEGLARLAEGDGRQIKRVQIDIIDGVFAENKTIGLEVLEGIETNLLLDIHLMVKEPVDWVEKSIRAMGDWIIGQVEMMSDQAEFVGKVQETGHKVGLALDLETPVSAIDPVLLLDLDVVLVMSVKAGFGGQEFQGVALQKAVRLLNERVNKSYKYKVCLDGGINIENIKQVAGVAIDEVAIGNSLFKGDIEENYRRLKETLK